VVALRHVHGLENVDVGRELDVAARVDRDLVDVLDESVVSVRRVLSEIRFSNQLFV